MNINFPTILGSSSDHTSSVTSMDSFDDCRDFLWGDPGRERGRERGGEETRMI